MSGFAYDTSTATIRVTLPDGEVVEVTGANDGVNGYEWSARMVGSGLILPVTVDEHVLVDGVNDPEDEERNWHAEGVFWTGSPGHEISRMDDMSEYTADGLPVFPGDMDAALYVARNGFPFVLYEKYGDGISPHWIVTAFDELDEATEYARDGLGLPDAVYRFLIDGRRYEEVAIPSAPGGDGYRAPGDALYVYEEAAA